VDETLYRRGEPYQRSRIAVVGSQGGAPRPITAGDGEGSPAWSPDGQWIAFTRGRFVPAGRIRGHPVSRLESALFVVHPDGSGLRQLTSGPYFDITPTWSRDGTEVAFARVRTEPEQVPGPSSLYVLDAAGGSPRPLGADGYSPAWSPDGSQLAFVSGRDRNGETCGEDECTPNGELYVMPGGGGPQVRLTNTKADDAAPAWSPDGSAIAFASERAYPGNYQYEIYTTTPDGQCVTRLTNASSSSSSPAWRPGAVALPGACGGAAAGAQQALVDVDLAPGLRFRSLPMLYLGPVHRHMLLSDLSTGGRRWFVDYGDCDLPGPRGCPGEIQLHGSSICSREPLLFDHGGPWGPAIVPRYSRRRGALLADYGEAGIDVHTGSLTLTIAAYPRGLGNEIVDSLQPLRGPTRRLLAPPAFARGHLRAIRLADAAFRRLRTVGGVAAELHVSRGVVRQRLALGRALRPFGRLRASRC
jgi:hypothetical protein